MSRRRTASGGPSHERLEVLPGGGRRFAHFKRAAVFYIIIALTALLVLQAGYHWMGPLILARRLQIVSAVEGFMEQRTEVEGMFASRELLLRAPCSGIIVELAPAGERAAAGTRAAVLAPLTAVEQQKLLEEEEVIREKIWVRIKAWLFRMIGGKDDKEREEEQLIIAGELPSWLQERMELVLPEAGLLLHQLDGWENTGEDLYLTSEQYSAAAKEPCEAVVGLYVEQDQPFLKLVDNWQLSYHVLLPLEPGRIAAARDEVYLEFNFAPGQPVLARLLSVEIDGEKEEVRLDYRISRQLFGFENLRRAEADLILGRQEGLIIPATALVDREGAQGVFLNQGGRVKFNEIVVIMIQEGEALVDGLEPGSLVIARPELVEEGQRLN